MAEIRKVMENSKTMKELQKDKNKKEVWLSGALTSQQTCLESYSEMDVNAEKNMKKFIAKSQELTKNALSILNGLSSIIKAPKIDGIDLSTMFHQKLLSSDFPDWMSSGDQKLFQVLAEVPKPNTKRFVINIKEGVYDEILEIPKGVENVMFIRDGPTKTIITGNVSVEKTPPIPTTFNTATVCKLYIRRKHIRELHWTRGYQVVALRASGDMSAFYNCHFKGFQDTLYANERRQFYRDCVIAETINFVFGDTRFVFRNCQLLILKPLDN
ncbi:putative pectinesterase/pectinesterase inhibitor 43 [Hibiscus syriacus]|uniref:putative pectinesterase/pectinesterase inhibitor 43 n=1 Tax=Hibiscus syriacus TaxID=106335 RepID=UPI001921C522|nr:putative pectinesterase/pectinesterase inhibitor 43 [Hibiscus syriacus]